MAEEGILQKLGLELRLNETDRTCENHEGVDSNIGDTPNDVGDRVKSRPHPAAALHSGQQSATEKLDLSDFLKSQKQQNEIMHHMMREFSCMRQDVAKLKALANDNVYEDVSEDEESAPAADTAVNAVCGETQTPASNDIGEKASTSILRQCAESLSLPERKGMSASAEIAQLVQKPGTLNIDEKKRTELDKHIVPENVPVLAAPKINQEIWRVISSEGRSKDIKLQKIQNGFLSAGVPVVRAVDKLLGRKSKLGAEVQEVVSLLVDSLALISSSSADMNMRRREIIQSTL